MTLLQTKLKHASHQDGYLDTIVTRQVREVGERHPNLTVSAKVIKPTLNNTEGCKGCLPKVDALSELMGSSRGTSFNSGEQADEEVDQAEFDLAGELGEEEEEEEEEEELQYLHQDKARKVSGCGGWCANNANDWSAKCSWGGCNSCPECPQPTPAPTNAPGLECKSWCAGNANNWAGKCGWAACMGCWQCPTPAPSTTTTASAAAGSECKGWCGNNPNAWAGKCSWGACSGCDQCNVVEICGSFCGASASDWTAKCNWESCKGCDECDQLPPGPCVDWCAGNANSWTSKCSWRTSCSGCDPCQTSATTTTAPPFVSYGAYGGPVARGMAGPGKIWNVGDAKGQGVAACFEAVMQEPRCTKDYFSYAFRADQNCVCKGSADELSVMPTGNSDYYLVTSYDKKGVGKPGPDTDLKTIAANHLPAGDDAVLNCYRAVMVDEECHRDYFAIDARDSDACVCKKSSDEVDVQLVSTWDYYKIAITPYRTVTGKTRDSQCRQECVQDAPTCVRYEFLEDNTCRLFDEQAYTTTTTTAMAGCHFKLRYNDHLCISAADDNAWNWQKLQLANCDPQKIRMNFDFRSTDHTIRIYSKPETCFFSYEKQYSALILNECKEAEDREKFEFRVSDETIRLKEKPDLCLSSAWTGVVEGMHINLRFCGQTGNRQKQFIDDCQGEDADYISIGNGLCRTADEEAPTRISTSHDDAINISVCEHMCDEHDNCEAIGYGPGVCILYPNNSYTKGDEKGTTRCYLKECPNGYKFHHIGYWNPGAFLAPFDGHDLFSCVASCNREGRECAAISYNAERQACFHYEVTGNVVEGEENHNPACQKACTTNETCPYCQRCGEDGICVFNNTYSTLNKSGYCRTAGSEWPRELTRVTEYVDTIDGCIRLCDADFSCGAIGWAFGFCIMYPEATYTEGNEAEAAAQCHVKNKCPFFLCARDYEGGCRTCVPAENRTQTNECSGCNPGHYLFNKSCHPQATCGDYTCPPHHPVHKGMGIVCSAGVDSCHEEQCCEPYHCMTRSSGSGCATCKPELNRTQPNDCASCNPGYGLNGTRCIPWRCDHFSGKDCLTCLKPEERTANNQCATCNAGYYINGTRCEPFRCTPTFFGPMCHKCKSQHYRTVQEHCMACNEGYFLNGTHCSPRATCDMFTFPKCNGSNPMHYGNETMCTTDVDSCDKDSCCGQWPCITTSFGPGCHTCKDPWLATTENDCATCNRGYYLNGTECMPYGCRRGMGSACVACVNQTDRVTDHDCKSCHAGYFLAGTTCYPYKCNYNSTIPGLCADCVDIWDRQKDNQCSKCAPDYYLVGSTCYEKARCTDFQCPREQPVSGGYDATCPTNNYSSCDLDSCCSKRATCDQFHHCGGDFPTPKGNETKCVSTLASCNRHTCCLPPARCDTYQCSSPYPVNKGILFECKGDESTCDRETCCLPWGCRTTNKGPGCHSCKPIENRTKNNDCDQCNEHYHHKIETSCAAWDCTPGMPGSGCKTCLPDEDRSYDEHCASCNPGYHWVVHMHRCIAWTCELATEGPGCGECMPQEQRTTINHCSSCNIGYYLEGTECLMGALCYGFEHCGGLKPVLKVMNVCPGDFSKCTIDRCCEPWACDKTGGRACAECLPIPERVRNNQCTECNTGYYLRDERCHPYRCAFGAGPACRTCMPQDERLAPDHCQTCNAGYGIEGTSCRPYTCSTGSEGSSCRTCITFTRREADNHCSACHIGFFLVGTGCVDQAGCDTYTECGGTTPVNAGPTVKCPFLADSCTARRCCEPRAMCTSYGDQCVPPWPVNKGMRQACDSNMASCNNETCCEPIATCDTFEECSGITPVNKGPDAQCLYDPASCLPDTCCEPYSCETGPDEGCKTCQPIAHREVVNHCMECNEGYYLKNGTECEIKATCGEFTECAGILPVHRGPTAVCREGVESCNIASCCEAVARCDQFGGCADPFPVNKGGGFECESTIDSCAINVCCEGPEPEEPVDARHDPATATTDDVLYWYEISRESFGVDDPLFPEETKATFNNNYDEPTSVTFMRVGRVDANEARMRLNENGVKVRGYMFKLMLEDTDQNLIADIEWAQANWLTQGSIAGYHCIYGCQRPPLGCPAFHGLCASINESWVMDDGPFTDTCYGIGAMVGKVSVKDLAGAGAQSLFMVAEETVAKGKCQACIQRYIMEEGDSQAERCLHYRTMLNLPEPYCQYCNKEVADHCKSV